MIPEGQIKKWKPIDDTEFNRVQKRISNLQVAHTKEMEKIELAKQYEKDQKASFKKVERDRKAKIRLDAKLAKEAAEDKERADKGLAPKRRTPKSMEEMNVKELERESAKYMKYLGDLAVLIQSKKKV